MNSTTVIQPISEMIRAARQELGLSQYVLADRLAAISGKPSMGRDRVARWERGSQIPRLEWRQWLSVVLGVPIERLDAGAEAARRQNRLGHAVVSVRAPALHGMNRRAQGTPAILPVFRSRVQAGILAATLLNPTRAFSLSELAEEAGGSLASVSKESRLLEDAGILHTRYEGAIRLMRAATDGPLLAPLTALIRQTYGVPQVVGEEFSRVSGVARISLTGAWAERFAGVTGPAPRTIRVQLTPRRDELPDRDDVDAAAQRVQRRLKRAVRCTIAHPRSLRPDRTTQGGRETGVVRWRAEHNGRPEVVVVPRAIQDTLPPSADAWLPGADVVSRMLDGGHLELFSGAAADHRPHFDLATRYLAAAQSVAPMSTESAFALVCHAAEQVGVGLLSVQGLRVAPGGDGGVVGEVAVAQFGAQFTQIEPLRRRLVALADPTWRDNRVAEADVAGAVSSVRAMLKAAQDLAIGLNMFA